MSCPTEITVDRFLAGALDEQGRRQVLAHLANCAPCCRLLGALVTSSSGGGGGGAGSLAPLAHSPPNEGARLAHYHVGDPIGFGGMGMVYSAYDPRLDRRVALKVLWGDGQQNAERLHHEARAMAKLAHPNVVPVFDVGVDRGRVYVAMELVLGGTMRAWLAAAPRPYTEVLARFRQAGSGLAAAHQAGLVHRDFKPENLLVRGDGTVLVTDFGLARVVAAGELVPSHARVEQGSRATESAGTPVYMAPEQLRGERLDARADVYAFSVALWEGLFGQRPFAPGSVDSLLASIARGPAAPPPRPGLPSVPLHIPHALARGMAFHPSNRPASIAELLAACDAAPVAPAPTPTPPLPRAEGGRGKGWLVAALAVAISAAIALTIGAGALWRARSGDPSAKGAAAPSVGPRVNDTQLARALAERSSEPSPAPPLPPREAPSSAPGPRPSPSPSPSPTSPTRDAGAPSPTPPAPTPSAPAVPVAEGPRPKIRGMGFPPYGFDDTAANRVRARRADLESCRSDGPGCTQVTCDFTVGPTGAVATTKCNAWAAKGSCSGTVACLTQKVRSITFPPPPKPGECQISFGQ